SHEISQRVDVASTWHQPYSGQQLDRTEQRNDMAEFTGQYNETQSADDMFDQVHEALSLVTGPIDSHSPRSIQAAITRMRAGETVPMESVPAGSEAHTEAGYEKVENTSYCNWLLSHLNDVEREIIERHYG